MRRKSLAVLAPGIVPALSFAAVSAGWLSLGKAFVWSCWLLVFALFAAGYTACTVSRIWRGLMFGLGIVLLRLLTH